MLLLKKVVAIVCFVGMRLTTSASLLIPLSPTGRPLTHPPPTRRPPTHPPPTPPATGHPWKPIPFTRPDTSPDTHPDPHSDSTTPPYNTARPILAVPKKLFHLPHTLLLLHLLTEQQLLF